MVVKLLEADRLPASAEHGNFAFHGPIAAHKGLEAALVSCCDLSRLRQTGKLSPKRSFLRIPHLHNIVAPLLVILRWTRSKVGIPLNHA